MALEAEWPFHSQKTPQLATESAGSVLIDSNSWICFMIFGSSRTCSMNHQSPQSVSLGPRASVWMVTFQRCRAVASSPKKATRLG